MRSAGCYSVLKGVEIHDHQVYRIDVEAAAVLVILLITTTSQDTTKDDRMERLYPSPQDGWKTGSILHLGTREIQAGDIVIGATGGEDLHTALFKLSQELLQPLFVIYRYKRSADRLATLC